MTTLFVFPGNGGCNAWDRWGEGVERRFGDNYLHTRIICCFLTSGPGTLLVRKPEHFPAHAMYVFTVNLSARWDVEDAEGVIAAFPMVVSNSHGRAPVHGVSVACSQPLTYTDLALGQTVLTLKSRVTRRLTVHLGYMARKALSARPVT